MTAGCLHLAEADSGLPVGLPIPAKEVNFETLELAADQADSGCRTLAEAACLLSPVLQSLLLLTVVWAEEHLGCWKKGGLDAAGTAEAALGSSWPAKGCRPSVFSDTS